MFSKIKAAAQSLSKKVLVSMTAAFAVVSATAASAFATTPPSTATDFSTTGGLSITPADVVSTGFSFANMFNNYTTLILGVILVPTVVGFIIWLWRKLPKFGGSKG